MRILYYFILLYNTALLPLINPAFQITRKKTYFISCLFIFFIGTFHSQIKFNNTSLNEPKIYGNEISNSINKKELDVYPDTLKNCVYLKYGFKSDKIINQNAWLAIKDEVVPYRIDIVYSKYPINKGVYSELYPLLLNKQSGAHLVLPKHKT